MPLNVAAVVVGIALSGSSATVVGAVVAVAEVAIAVVAAVTVDVAVVAAHNLPFACLIIYLRCTVA